MLTGGKYLLSSQSGSIKGITWKIYPGAADVQVALES